MLQQHIYVYINTHTNKIYVSECCSLLKSYNLYILITNLMHRLLLLFIYLFTKYYSSTCFEP